MDERDLDKLCANVRPIMAEPTYVYCCLPDFAVPVDLTPLCVIREEEGLTVIIEKVDAQRLALPYTFEARMITLTVHSSLEAVGFLAVITARLARANIPCNAIAGYHHDHVLVPVARATEALALLRDLTTTRDKAC